MSASPRLSRTGTPPRIGIVHLGPGAFFRGFNAVYTDEAMAAEGGDWGILAISLRSPAARDQLEPQGGVYSSVTLSEAGLSFRIVGSVVGVLVAPEDPAAVIDAIADPKVKIVSMTITEKGYCHEPATGKLNFDHPDIVHDLANPKAPRSMAGFVVAALERRRANDQSAFTVLSCDNLPANGALARGTILDFARATDPALAEWIEAEAAFPATMVDRITPATTDADISRLAQLEGYQDPGCVMHEAFRQWVIEDDFVDGRPAWEAAGAQLVTSVDAHELMKLRCLNGTHSTLAYLGYLAGHETIADCVGDPLFADLCARLWRDEITPVVAQPDGEDLDAYCASLLRRYRDPSIRHRTWQIAMDGSQKLPQRLLGTIRDNLAKERVPEGLCLAVAGWMRYVGGVDETGAPIDVRDPLAERLKDASDAAQDKVGALLDFEDIFSADLRGDVKFRRAVTAAYERVVRLGAQGAVRHYLRSQ